jgi:Flp pilus assembly protein TadG
MARKIWQSRQRRGAVAVEVCLILVFLVPMIIGAWEIGRAVEAQQILVNAAREGARQASTGQKTTAQVQQVVLNYLQAAGLTNIKNQATDSTDLQTGGKVLVTINVYDVNTGALKSGVDPTAAAQGDRLDVNVTILYRDVRWSVTQMFMTSSAQLTASADWNSMVDIPITVNTTIPLE